MTMMIIIVALLLLKNEIITNNKNFIIIIKIASILSYLLKFSRGIISRWKAHFFWPHDVVMNYIF